MKIGKGVIVLSLVGLGAGILSMGAGERDVRAAAKVPRPYRALARDLVEKGGVERGVCGLLGCGDERIVLQLARSSELSVHVQEPDASAVEAVRKLLDNRRLYGKRVIVEKGALDCLPYADDLLDVVICTSLSDQLLDSIPPSEVLRVLRPQGKAVLGRAKLARRAEGQLTRSKLQQWLGRARVEGATLTKDKFGLWAEFAKPVPQGVDDWSHWQHGPDNNPFSNDTVIKAPYLTQFLALPWFSTMPSISVISGGRMFRAAGHMAIHDREERYLNTLYATNAYNGTLLWTRPIPANFLVHRSVFVATPDVFYVMDEKCCLLLDPQTGEEKDSIVPPPEVAEDPYWKWIALDNGVLYGLLGGEEYSAEIIKRHRPTGAWGWDELSRGYYEKKYPWGFGNAIVAIDPQTKKLLWTHKEEKPIDSRALCMADGRVFLHSEGAFVACLDQKSGEPLWKNDDARLLRAISEPNDQGLGFKTTPYALCADGGLFFGGRGRKNVVAVSAGDGRFLWSVPGAYNATNLLYRGSNLYAHIPACKMLNPLTGEVMKDLGIAKRSCARFTGCPDSLFHRGSVKGGEGTTRYILAEGEPTVIHAFRPPCNDGIIPAQGHLYATQWDCDCNLQLIGMISLSPAGDFGFDRKATESERLETTGGDLSAIISFADSAHDWPTYRADNSRSSSTEAIVAEHVEKRWEFEPDAPFSPSPPTAAGGLVFLGGDDCKARAIDTATGKERWSFWTGGPVRLPPSIWKGRAFAGSADGYIYALEAATGRLLWRFRAAPVERKIMVYGSLCSTWPVNSGVLAEDGTVYAAAGIINYDGTHVYALDAVTGKIRWQNNSSGHLNGELREGPSVQGDLALLGNRLLLAGGNVTSPGVYDVSGGGCLNAPPDAGWPSANRGSEVCGFMGKYPMVGGRRLFTQDDDVITNWQPFDVLDPRNVSTKLGSEFRGRVPPAFGNGLIAFSGRGPLMCLDAEKIEQWLRKERTGVKERWRANSIMNSVSVVVAGNAIVAAGESGLSSGLPTRWSVQAFDINDGKMLWGEPVASPPLPGGLCVDKSGEIIAVLEDGKVICLGKKE